MSENNDYKIPEMMRAIYCDKFKEQPVVKNVPVPKPKPGEILVKIMAVPIQPADLAFIVGQYKSLRKPPTMLGTEGCGLVVKNGGGLIGWNLLGRKVGFICKDSKMGTWAEYVIAQSTQCVPMDMDTPYEVFAGTLINPTSVLLMLEVTQKEKHRAVIQTAACSTVGKMINRFFPANGIKVINVVRRKEQEDIMKNDENAQYVLNSSDPDFPKQIQEMTSKLNATCLFDVVAGELTNTILKNMPYKSTAYIYGALSTQNIVIEPNELIFRKKQVKGFWLSDHIRPKSMLWRILQGYLLKDWLKNLLSANVAMEFPFEKVNEAIEYYKANMSKGKVLLKPWIDTIRLPTYQNEMIKPKL